jgi:REP element-mobilizing transposase RayT
MPRPPRFDAPGAFHHVTARGVERREIFLDDDDRAAYVDRFERLACDLGFRCDALTLLGNHVHAVIQTRETPLATLMHRLNFFHAQRFNRANTRVGHLFESRYKARRVDDEADLVRVVAYAIGNPLRHQVVESLDALYEDPWNLLSVLSGRRRAALRVGVAPA